MRDRVMQMVGLAKKAGRCVSGEFKTEEAIKKLDARLVIIAEDASEQTKKHFTDMCRYREIPICLYGSKQQLGKFTGKELRAAAAITDSTFAQKIEAMIREVAI